MFHRPLKLSAITAFAAVLAAQFLVVPASADDGAAEPVTHDVVHTKPVSGEDFWTDEQLRAATPLDMPMVNPAQQSRSARPKVNTEEPTVFTEPAAPQDDTADTAQAESAVVPTTVGRLFFLTPQGPSSCTASTVNGADGTRVITAAHCVHGGKGGGWYSNFIFIPSYYNGARPFGIWFGVRVATFKGWTDDRNYSLDQAFVTLARKNGTSIVQAVGGNGLVGGHGPNVDNNRIWGYPAAPPYDGELPYYCDGAATSVPSSSDSQMACAMNQGASGGPWLKDRVNANLGYTWAVSSRCAATPDGRECLLTTLYATPNPRAIFDLLNA